MQIARHRRPGSQSLVGRVHHLHILHGGIFQAAVAERSLCFICEGDLIGGFSTEV